MEGGNGGIPLPPPTLPPTLTTERSSLLDGGGGGGPAAALFTNSSSSAGLGLTPLAAFDGVEGGGDGAGGSGGGPSSDLAHPHTPPVPASAVSPAIAAKVDRGLLPALCTLTLVNYLDR
jgi:hypothetical protein